MDVKRIFDSVGGVVCFAVAVFVGAIALSMVTWGFVP
jgi:hypothetical protein